MDSILNKKNEKFNEENRAYTKPNCSMFGTARL